MQAYEPYGRLGHSMLQALLVLLAVWQLLNTQQQPGQADPWGSALSTAMGLGGLYGQYLTQHHGVKSLGNLNRINENFKIDQCSDTWRESPIKEGIMQDYEKRSGYEL